MMYVPKEELKIVAAALCRWQSPLEFRAEIQALNNRVPSSQFFRQTGFQFAREATNAADFAGALNCDQVHLVEQAERWPDFEIRAGGVIKKYEVVLAMECGRNWSAENWDSPESVPVSEWRKAAENAPIALRKAVAKKVGKNYTPNRSGLVIYLNLSTFGLGETEIVADFHNATAPAKDKFTEVWVLWGARHYLLWQDGKQSSLVVQAHLEADEPDELTPGAAFQALFGESYDDKLFRN